jgi:hypothetical protein
MTFKDFFIKSFSHDYRPGEPDFKKIMAFHFSLVLSFICIYLIIARPEGNEGLIVGSLCAIIGGLVGFNIIPIMSKTGSVIKQQEMQQFNAASNQTPTKEDLIKRAKLVGLPETATEDEIKAAEALKLAEDKI